MSPYLLEKTGTSFGREYPRLGKSAVDGTKVAEEAEIEGGAGVFGRGGMYVCDGTEEPGWK